ncbi:hypothetical protein B0H13DRAFT_1920385 [Mycena leptocephala]|nr:hypothetical protein B0H13DRAFT_1920385 [Mycena leptocephala]
MAAILLSMNCRQRIYLTPHKVGIRSRPILSKPGSFKFNVLSGFRRKTCYSKDQTRPRERLSGAQTTPKVTKFDLRHESRCASSTSPWSLGESTRAFKITTSPNAVRSRPSWASTDIVKISLSDLKPTSATMSFQSLLTEVLLNIINFSGSLEVLALRQTDRALNAHVLAASNGSGFAERHSHCCVQATTTPTLLRAELLIFRRLVHPPPPPPSPALSHKQLQKPMAWGQLSHSPTHSPNTRMPERDCRHDRSTGNRCTSDPDLFRVDAYWRLHGATWALIIQVPHITAGFSIVHLHLQDASLQFLWRILLEVPNLIELQAQVAGVDVTENDFTIAHQHLEEVDLSGPQSLVLARLLRLPALRLLRCTDYDIGTRSDHLPNLMEQMDSDVRVVLSPFPHDISFIYPQLLQSANKGWSSDDLTCEAIL